VFYACFNQPGSDSLLLKIWVNGERSKNVADIVASLRAGHGTKPNMTDKVDIHFGNQRKCRWRCCFGKEIDGKASDGLALSVRKC